MFLDPRYIIDTCVSRKLNLMNQLAETEIKYKKLSIKMEKEQIQIR